MQLDADKFRGLVGGLPSAQILIATLSNRQRNKKYTGFKHVQLDVAKSGGSVSMKDVETFFKALEKSGAGRIIYNKSGNGHSFEWSPALTMKGVVRDITSAPSLQLVPKLGRFEQAPGTDNLAFVQRILFDPTLTDTKKVEILKAYLK